MLTLPWSTPMSLRAYLKAKQEVSRFRLCMMLAVSLAVSLLLLTILCYLLVYNTWDPYYVLLVCCCLSTTMVLLFLVSKGIHFFHDLCILTPTLLTSTAVGPTMRGITFDILASSMSTLPLLMSTGNTSQTYDVSIACQCYIHRF